MFFNRIIPNKVKIITILLISFIISSFIKKEFFLGSSPFLKQPLNHYFANKVKWAIYLFKYGSQNETLTSKELSPSTLKNLQEVIYEPLNKLSPGIYAQTKGNVMNVVLKENEIEWIEYRIKIDGEEKVLKIPKGMELPPKEQIEWLMLNTK